MTGQEMSMIRKRLEGQKKFDKEEFYEKDVRALFMALESVQLKIEKTVMAIDHCEVSIEQGLLESIRKVAKGSEF